MTFTKTALLPVSPDEAFALITEPERLRRWQTVSAYVDLRAGGGYRLTVSPATSPPGTFREVEPGKRDRLRLGLGGQRRPAAGRLDGDRHDRAGRGRLPGDPGPRGPQRGAGRKHAEGWNHYFERWRSSPPPATPARTSGPGRREDLTPVIAADAVLAVDPADPAQPHRRGPAEADAVRGVHLPRARRAPARLARPARRDGRRDRGQPQEGSLENRVSVMAAQAIDAWRARRPRRHRARARRREMPAVVRGEHPAARAPPARLGPRPGQRPGAARLRRGRRLPAHARR